MASPNGGASKPSAPATSLIPCKYCNRTFSGDALTRHQPVCIKKSLSNRRPFNSLKQRVEGTEIKQYVDVTRAPSRATTDSRLKTRGVGNGGGKQAASKSSATAKPTWRRQHEELINAVRNARLAKLAIKSGLPLPPPPPPSLNPDYVQCPYCLRRFNESAADRHIPFCKGKSLNPSQMKLSASLKAKSPTLVSVSTSEITGQMKPSTGLKVKSPTPCTSVPSTPKSARQTSVSTPGTPTSTRHQSTAPHRLPFNPQRSPLSYGTVIHNDRYSGQRNRTDASTAIATAAATATGRKCGLRTSSSASAAHRPDGQAVGKPSSKTVKPTLPVRVTTVGKETVSASRSQLGNGNAPRVEAKPTHSTPRLAGDSQRYNVKTTG